MIAVGFDKDVTLLPVYYDDLSKSDITKMFIKNANDQTQKYVLEINFIDLKFRFDNTRRENTTS